MNDMDEDGRSVLVAVLQRGWFRITRTAGVPGVRLHSRIPGYPPAVTSHATQAEAGRAAETAYGAYLADVGRLA